MLKNSLKLQTVLGSGELIKASLRAPEAIVLDYFQSWVYTGYFSRIKRPLTRQAGFTPFHSILCLVTSVVTIDSLTIKTMLHCTFYLISFSHWKMEAMEKFIEIIRFGHFQIWKYNESVQAFASKITISLSEIVDGKVKYKIRSSKLVLQAAPRLALHKAHTKWYLALDYFKRWWRFNNFVPLFSSPNCRQPRDCLCQSSEHCLPGELLLL